MIPRTDLASEARALFLRDASHTTRLEGVLARKRCIRDVTLERVEILDARGANALKKPCGSYETLEFDPQTADFPRLRALLAQRLRKMLPEGSVLLVGLGNRAVTPDALGPQSIERVFLTRHLRAHLPGHFSAFREVSAVCPGVLATTGIESAEIVRAAAACVRPESVLVIDALCAAEEKRLCTSVQLSDAGIVPGSGVGNHRAPLDRKTLGVPVCSLGVPTVAGAAVFGARENRILTPRDIDEKIRFFARLLSGALNCALYPQLSARERAQLFPNS